MLKNLTLVLAVSVLVAATAPVHALNHGGISTGSEVGYGALIDPGGVAVGYGALIDPGGVAVSYGALIDPGGVAVSYGALIDPGGVF